MRSSGDKSPDSGSAMDEPVVSQAALWFGLLGGGVAWLAHLLGSYFIGEFGCVSGWGQNRILGVTQQGWFLLGLSALTALWAGYATWVGYRSKQRLGMAGSMEEPDLTTYMARAGYLTSGVFLFIIVVESVPIFFFLRSC